MKLLIIDNYDSFTYNLVQYFGELGAALEVRRNDEISVDAVTELNPDRICISPGPGRPESGNQFRSNSLLWRKNTFSVRLGHQCIAQVFGGEVVRAEKLMHGKASLIRHNERGVFEKVAQPLEATRYHSLIVRRESLPDALEITAETEEGEIMALQHRKFPVHGVQFHPESILTSEGKKLLANFLRM